MTKATKAQATKAQATNITFDVKGNKYIVSDEQGKFEIPYVSTAKGIKWFVTKGEQGDYISFGFKLYANGETRVSIYLHDYADKFAKLKTLDGKALTDLCTVKPMTKGHKYCISGLSSLANFAPVFRSFEQSRLDDKAKAQAKATKAQAKPTEPTKATKAQAKPTEPTKAQAKAQTATA